MNFRMWQHPATQQNCKTLQKRGVVFVGPAEGRLACGAPGKGRFAPVEEILEAVEKSLKAKN